MNHFDWDNLRVFLGVARARSALEASHSLGMNQSTISRRLHRLERDMGSKLFDRNSQGHRLTSAGHRLLDRGVRDVRPTDIGETVLGYARRMLSLNEQLAEALSGDGAAVVIRLGVP